MDLHTPEGYVSFHFIHLEKKLYIFIIIIIFFFTFVTYNYYKQILMAL